MISHMESIYNIWRHNATDSQRLNYIVFRNYDGVDHRCDPCNQRPVVADGGADHQHVAKHVGVGAWCRPAPQ